MKWNSPRWPLRWHPCVPQRRHKPDPAGAKLAAACANCHGTNGVAQSGKSAGGNKDELLKKMLDFKTGKSRQPSYQPGLFRRATTACRLL